MAEPDKLEQFRQAAKIKEDALEYLGEREKKQNDRWTLVHEIADDAAWQYFTMRLDAVEESLRDKGAPLWLSIVFTVAVTLIPVSAWTSSFLGVLTTSTQNLLTRANRKLLTPLSKGSRDDYYKFLSLKEEIKRTEKIVFSFYKRYEAELTDTLQSATKDLAKDVA